LIEEIKHPTPSIVIVLSVSLF